MNKQLQSLCYQCLTGLISYEELLKEIEIFRNTIEADINAVLRLTQPKKGKLRE